MDRMVDVTDGITAAAYGEALSPIRNLGEQLVVLEHLFDDFEGNINWEDDDEVNEDNEDDANGMVAQQPIILLIFVTPFLLLEWLLSENAVVGNLVGRLCRFLAKTHLWYLEVL